MSLFSKARNAGSRLLTFAQMYAQHFPVGMKMIFMIGCKVRLIQGPMKKSGTPLTLLYVGRNMNYHYLLRTVFEEYEILEEKRASVLSARRHLKELKSKCDVTTLDIGWPYHGPLNRNGEYLELPDWANLALVLGESWEETVQLFHKTARGKDLRYIRKEGYRAEPTTDREVIKNFYRSMYLPYIRSRHGQDTTKVTCWHMVRQARKGCLLQIYKDDEVVTAGVLYPEKGVLFFLWLGVPEKYIEAPPRAAISALYYFGIQYAHQHECWAVDFMGSRAFLTDGVFRFKRKWGAFLQDTFSPSSVLLRPNNGNSTAARFCCQFPVMIRRGEDLEGIYLSLDEKVDEEKLIRIQAEYGCDGMKRMTVVDISGQSEPGSRDLTLKGHDFRLIGADLETFADHYAEEAVPCSSF